MGLFFLFVLGIILGLVVTPWCFALSVVVALLVLLAEIL